MIEELAEWIMHAEYNQRELRVKLRELVTNNNEVLLAKLPEKQTRHLKKCYTDQFKCLCGMDGFNLAIDQVTAIIKGAKR